MTEQNTQTLISLPIVPRHPALNIVTKVSGWKLAELDVVPKDTESLFSKEGKRIITPQEHKVVAIVAPVITPIHYMPPFLGIFQVGITERISVQESLEEYIDYVRTIVSLVQRGFIILPQMWNSAEAIAGKFRSILTDRSEVLFLSTMILEAEYTALLRILPAEENR